MPELQKPQVSAVEGSEATVEAFRRLTATFIGALTFKLPPSAEDLRDLQKKAVQSVENAAPIVKPTSFEQAGLSRRDYIPLSIALFVDLCLLLVSIGRPASRMNGLVPKMRAAENGPVSEILTRFNDIHKDPQIRESFEIFRHVIFDFNGDYYAAVPLDAPKTKTAMVPVKDKTGAVRHAERRVAIRNEDRHDLQLDAHQLANLFTSFEKERIFARVMMPVLTTRAIQKKLARQGSKFAEAEAFRIYKFKDGAWQEMILGAIMGAAKRVESQNAELAEARAHELPLPRQNVVEPRYAANDEAPLTAPPMYADNVTALPRKMQAGYNPAHEPRHTAATARHEPAFERPSAGMFANPAAAAPEPTATHEFNRGPINDTAINREIGNPMMPEPTEPTVTTDASPAFNPLPKSFASMLRAKAIDPQVVPQEEPNTDLQFSPASNEPTVEIEARRESMTCRMPLRDALLHASAVEHAPPANEAMMLDLASVPPQPDAAPQLTVPNLEVDVSRAPFHRPQAIETTSTDIDFRRIAGKFGLNTTRN